jgi:hypothetical protein
MILARNSPVSYLIDYGEIKYETASLTASAGENKLYWPIGEGIVIRPLSKVFQFFPLY